MTNVRSMKVYLERKRVSSTRVNALREFEIEKKKIPAVSCLARS